MRPQSSHTQRGAQRRYVPGSSRGGRNATTLLAQVADIERGTRIRERREELHLTQPGVVELIEQLQDALPTTHRLHRDVLGKAPVGLRGYQTWEAGGGIDWEKAKLLAEVLQMDVREMMHGPREDQPTPDPFADADQDARIAAMEARLMEQADMIRGLIDDQNKLLERQSEILARIEAAVDREDLAATKGARLLDQAAEHIAQVLPAAAPAPEAAPKEHATSGSRQG